ncbi:uncharacterized protein LOC131677466 [Topomyia yanbarensis]|uniref:uncharacterized protein LOC131677458 n=1 Tax=Topomyia yanbarensis TaxID=2498891 RepID=UPI00273C665D|nr:uncharacterized protein LOC131677458 [Topomyia yanbarensis]XP_058813283.1 uncharacterized protein LOC131677466 [Topomyia yanbarensis]
MVILNNENDGYDIEDLEHFMICFNCTRCSPFLIYAGSNERVEKYRPLNSGVHLYCPDCSPDPDHFAKVYPGEKRLFAESSILNDKQLLATLAQFKYYNPHYEQLASPDRIIITENTKLLQPYSKISKKPLPRAKKLERLMSLFPELNRMPNIRFASQWDVCAAVKKKYAEISDNYMALSEQQSCELYDIFDTMAGERTPQVQRQERLSQRDRPSMQSISAEEPMYSTEQSETQSIQLIISTDSSFATDMIRLQDGSTEGSAAEGQISVASLVVSSQDREDTSLAVDCGSELSEQTDFAIESGISQNISSQLPSQQDFSNRTETSSQSVVFPEVNVSSQSLPRTQTVFTIDENVETDDGTINHSDEADVPNPPRKRLYSQQSSQSVSLQSQTAGPSSSGMPPKRIRFSLPVNPDPLEYRPNYPSARIPRLGGG